MCRNVIGMECRLNATDNENNNVLMQCDEAWSEGNEELRLALIRAGCSINQQNDKGENHLVQAVESAHINAIEELIAHGQSEYLCR